MRFVFIDIEKKAFPLFLLCKVMLVSRSGYYHWKKRGTSAREKERANLNALGFHCGKHKAGTLMKLAGVEAKQRKKFKATTDSTHTFPVAPNLLNRRFSVTTPN